MDLNTCQDAISCCRNKAGAAAAHGSSNSSMSPVQMSANQVSNLVHDLCDGGKDPHTPQAFCTKHLLMSAADSYLRMFASTVSQVVSAKRLNSSGLDRLMSSVNHRRIHCICLSTSTPAGHPLASPYLR